MKERATKTETKREPWIAKRSKQLILKEINTEYSLERLISNLQLQYFGHLMRRANSLEKTLMLGKIENRRRRGQQRMKCLDGITNSMDISLNNFWEIMGNSERQGGLACHYSWCHKEPDTT